MNCVTTNCKTNCWEFHNCGREPGGVNSLNGNICPASVESTADGINRGKNAGRCCWAITGTLCLGEPQGNKSEKLKDCVNCNFFKSVQEEEHRNFSIFSEVMSRQKQLNS